MGAWTRDHLQKIIKENNKCFKQMKLNGADFTGMDLEKADFRSASLPFAIFDNANCKFANFENAELTLTRWNGANLHRANLKDATLSDADMSLVTDFFGVTITLECRSFQGLRLPPGFWYGWLYYAGGLMVPPSEEVKEKLMLVMGPERYKVLREQYANRRM